MGDSHSRCLAHAAHRLRRDDIEVLRLPPGRKPDWEGAVPYETVLERIGALSAGDLLVLAVLGRMHGHYGLLHHEVPFDIIEGPDDRIAPRTALIPLGQMKQAFLDSMNASKKVLRMGAMSPCPVVMLAAPPLADAPDQLIALLSPHRAAGFALGDIRLRTKLWRIEMACLAEFAQQHGHCALMPPAQSHTDDDVLRPEYYDADPLHANAAYGKLVIGQFQDL